MGEHTLTAVFEDGSADATFTVATAATPAKSTLAKTGDNVVPIAAGLTVALIAAAALLVARRKLD